MGSRSPGSTTPGVRSRTPSNHARPSACGSVLAVFERRIDTGHDRRPDNESQRATTR